MRRPLASIALVMLAACGDDGAGAAHDAAVVITGDGVIGAAGGEVHAGSSASVSIPAGALSTDLTITVSSTQVTAPAAQSPVGTAFIFGPEGTQFTVPATVTLTFDPAAIPSPRTASDLVIYTAPAGSTDYVALDTSLVDTTHVSAQTSHFSVFVATVPTPVVMTDAGVDPDASLDAPANNCAPVEVVSGNNCDFTAMCNGHTYVVSCGVNSCVCTVDGGNSHQVNKGTTCSSPAGQPAWGFCQFP